MRILKELRAWTIATSISVPLYLRTVMKPLPNGDIMLGLFVPVAGSSHFLGAGTKLAARASLDSGDATRGCGRALPGQ